jgi:DNA invertase Pin-like site-specific DNA recombinase
MKSFDRVGGRSVVNAKEFDMVTAWSVDRLGRSLTDLLGIL